MKTPIALLLICVGVWFFHAGWVRRDSLVGRTQSTLASVVRRIDGETRVPAHSWYMIAGGLSVFAGVWVLYAGRRGE